MCWSSDASLSFFVIGMVICSWLLLRNGAYDRMFGLFFIWVIGMQLLEYLIWLDQDCDGNLNNIACQIAWFQNLMQPVIGGILVIVYIYSQKPKPIIPLPLFISILLGYVIWFISWIFMEKPYNDKMCAKPCQGCEHNLQWPWIENYDSSIWVGYFIAFSTMVIASFKNKGGRVLSSYLLITCLIAICFLPLIKSIGSWWCVFAVGGPVLKTMIPLSYFKN